MRKSDVRGVLSSRRMVEKALPLLLVVLVVLLVVLWLCGGVTAMFFFCLPGGSARGVGSWL